MQEKEIKTFFNKDNKLNRGYKKMSNPREEDDSFYRKKFEHLLPPIDILNEYENIYPGTLAKLMEMTQKEQQHRQAAELIHAENYKLAVKMGRNGLVMAIVAICITTIILAYIDDMVPVLFPLFGFSMISLLALLAHIRMTRKRNFDYRNQRNHINSVKT